MPASATHTSSGRHQPFDASRPATAKQARRKTRIPTTSAGLSQWPSTEIARSAAAPGVSLMTSSPTATTGDSRMRQHHAVA